MHLHKLLLLKMNCSTIEYFHCLKMRMNLLLPDDKRSSEIMVARVHYKHIYRNMYHTGGATPRVLGHQLAPPPPLGAFGQQLVAKGAQLRSPWASKVPDAPRARKAPEDNFCLLRTPTLSLNLTLTLTATPTLSLVLTGTEYWDQAGGGRNIV